MTMLRSQIYKTRSKAAFLQNAGQGYPFSYLQRSAAELSAIHHGFSRIIAEAGEQNFQVFMSQDGRPLINDFRNVLKIDAAAKHELEDMVTSYHAITGAHTMRAEIRKAFYRPSHPHSYAVLNSNWGSVGTGVETETGAEYAQEADLAFIGRNVMHFSHPDSGKGKITVAVFESEPDVY